MSKPVIKSEDIYCPYYLYDRKSFFYCEGGKVHYKEGEIRDKYMLRYCASKENHNKCTLCQMLNEKYNIKEEVKEEVQEVKKDVKFYNFDDLPKGEVHFIMSPMKQRYFETKKDVSKGRTTYIFVSHLGHISQYVDEESGETIDVAFRYIHPNWRLTHVDSGLKIAEYNGTLSQAEEHLKQILPSIIRSLRIPSIKKYVEHLEEYKKEMMKNETL